MAILPEKYACLFIGKYLFPLIFCYFDVLRAVVQTIANVQLYLLSRKFTNSNISFHMYILLHRCFWVIYSLKK